MTHEGAHPASRCGIRPSHAWRCTKDGHPGMIVYCQTIAIDKMAEHFDIEIGRIDYSTTPRTIQWGAI